MVKYAQRRRRPPAKKKQPTLATYIIITAILAFGIMVGLLFQQSAINEVNNEIRVLKAELDEAIALNDSKEGKLVTNMDLAAIEVQARGYGMTEPTESQYRYETTEGNTRVSKSDGEKQFESWVDKILN